MHPDAVRLDPDPTSLSRPRANPAFPSPLGTIKTSSPRIPSSPSAPAQDRVGASKPVFDLPPQTPRSASSLSSSSTADDGELSSPVLPSLPAPKLPGRAEGFLRSPSPTRDPQPAADQFITASWGSPYTDDQESKHFHALSLTSSESEEDEEDDSALHQLEVNTPFLRPAPESPAQDSSPQLPPYLTGSAAVLATRARRPLGGITEDWIRHHLTDEIGSEQTPWFSDGTEDSEHSSLSGSLSGDHLEEVDPSTPRARTKQRVSSQASDPTPSRHRNGSSIDTLKQAITNRSRAAKMDTFDTAEKGGQEPARLNWADTPVESPLNPPEFPELGQMPMNGSAEPSAVEPPAPATPPKPTKPVPTQTPRLKKKVPWKGKNIMVLLPRDEDRGKPGKAPRPLTARNVASIFREWEELGYDTRGFDLDGSYMSGDQVFENDSQSRNQWPDEGDLTWERTNQQYEVQLPDLNAWKNYVDELTEAKLRALGVLEPEPEPEPEPSPVPSNVMSQASNQYPPLPFSPPLPTHSAASVGQQGFPFQPPFLHGASGTQSPAIPNAGSPAPFHAPHLQKFNNRASISVSPGELPFQFSGQPSPAGWNPQMLLQQQLGRAGSPSMMHINSLISPSSPFGDGMSPGMHQRHQSAQFPMMPHQMLHRQDSARASPRLQDLREIEEDNRSNPYEDEPPRSPEPEPFVQNQFVPQHNASNSLQNEIDDAEYHLEEQFRSQLEQPDYSPHKENGKAQEFSNLEAETEEPAQQHNRGPSVHFGNFGTDSDEGPKLHHPQPHSRGHSLSQQVYLDNEETRDGAEELEESQVQADESNVEKPDESYEIETNPSNLGTPVSGFGMNDRGHDRTISKMSNPWADERAEATAPESKHSSRAPSHGSKLSFSKFNPKAAEFKFNPTADFTPGGFTPGNFNFGSSSNTSFSPAPFQAPTFAPHMPQQLPRHPAPNHFSVPSGSDTSQTPANGPGLFSPNKSSFSFSARGPKFNPNMPSFQPKSFASSINSNTVSGNEAGPGPVGHGRSDTIFGNLNLKDIIKPTKKSKAIPIIKPSSKSPSPDPESFNSTNNEAVTADVDRSKKKFRDETADGDSVPQFAEPTPEPESFAIPTKEAAEEDVSEEDASEEDVSEETSEAAASPTQQVEEKPEEEEAAHIADTTLASTVPSESTDGKVQSDANDTKATTSPSATSPDQDKPHWQPFEFRNEGDIRDFAAARPFGDEDPIAPVPVPAKSHKNSLSASAKEFVPGSFTFGAQNNTVETPFEPILKQQPEPMAQVESEAEKTDEQDDEWAGSPTPGPEPRAAPEPVQEPVFTFSANPSPLPVKNKGLGSSRFASPPPAPKPKGLGASRFATEPSPPPPAPIMASPPPASPSPITEDEQPLPVAEPAQEDRPADSLLSFEPLPVSPPSAPSERPDEEPEHEPTFEEIDAVMRYMNGDPAMGVKRNVDSPKWQPSPHQTPAQSPLPAPVALAPPDLPLEIPVHIPVEVESPRHSPIRENIFHEIPISAVNTSPLNLPRAHPWRSDIPSRRPSPAPREYRTLPQQVTIPVPSTELDDPFVDPPHRNISQALSQAPDGNIHHLNYSGSHPESEWDDAFSADEQTKLEQRAKYFDGHVNDLVGNLLASRLEPVEKTLDIIQDAVATLSRRAPSSRRDRRSISGEVRDSDADDEDEEVPMRKSMSPRRDRKMDHIRMAVMDAFNQQQSSRSLQAAQLEPITPPTEKDDSAVLKALEEMREALGQVPRVDLSSEDVRGIVQEAMQNHIPPPAPVIQDDEESTQKMAEMTGQMSSMQSKIADLERRLHTEEGRTEDERNRVKDLEERLRIEAYNREEEISNRRAVEDRASELRRQLEQAETKVEVEIMNRSIFDQRTHDLEDRLKAQERKTDLEHTSRREAEDRLSEIQRLLRISSEEEDRLRSVVDERDQKIKGLEQASGKTSMRVALLQANQDNADKSQNELRHRLNIVDSELRDTREEVRHWRSEAEQARQALQKHEDDLVQSNTENKHMHKLIDTLGVQIEENEKIRDNWRVKFIALQDDMAHAAREITEENSRRTKKEQALLARQEVLDARLQAEARTRERLEQELDRLEAGERSGMRAVGECKRLEGLLTELRDENHGLQQDILHVQRELKDARESAATEVDRSQAAMRAELEAANTQVNTARLELEDEMTKARAQLDQVKLDADTAKAHHEMMLEEAQNSKTTELEELAHKHQSYVEDLQARYERQINNGAEDAQRMEQNLLERLSLSTSKTEHLQDRITHLEDKVQVAQEAAKAAAQAASQAKTIIPEAVHQHGPVGQTKQLAQAMQLPEKISPQALRESIMVLQEQLQAREQRIEELEQIVAKLDPEGPTKISKRDDEISWLRELLAVRHGDLQDIIRALSSDNVDKEVIKDATIRLKANLQMEEQERERAMNGGSAINLPGLLKTPRVAQAVGPLAAAWGSWRKASNVLTSPAPSAPPRHGTPSRLRPGPRPQRQDSLRSSGLMTPPASNIRNSPVVEQEQEEESEEEQPTAFGTTGRRLTAEQFANRGRNPSMSLRQAEKMPMPSTPPSKHQADVPVTPTMMSSGGYDADAQAQEFDDAAFFDD